MISQVYLLFKVKLSRVRIRETIDFYAKTGVIEPLPLPSIDDLIVGLSK